MKKQDMDIIEALQTEVELPAVVQRKANAAFRKVRLSAAEEHSHEHSSGRNQSTNQKKHYSAKRIVILVAAAVLALSGITVTAAYLHWSRSLTDGLQISEEQQIVLEEKNAVAFTMQECTVNGVTVTAVQSITDHYFTHMVFRVEGYRPEAGMEPGFERIDVTVDGKTLADSEAAISLEGGFYNGLITGPDGRAVYADGSPVPADGDRPVERYVAEDGSMEYRVTLGTGTKGYFLNQPVRVELHNLGTLSRAEYHNAVEGTWSFEWNLNGMELIKDYTLEEALGDTGATVTRAELSPISFHIAYDFPRKQITDCGLDENGNMVESSRYTEPPMLTGFKMKDGSLITYLGNGGRFGYESEESDTYYATFAMSRVIDVEQIDSLLFIDSYPADGEPLAEENLYIVPIP